MDRQTDRHTKMILMYTEILDGQTDRQTYKHDTHVY